MGATESGVKVSDLKPQTRTERRGDSPFNEAAVYPGDRGYSDVSWWVGLTREQFSERMTDEQPRLMASHYGRVSTLTHEAYAPDLLTRKPQQREPL